MRRERSNATERDEARVDLDRIEPLASTAGLTIEEFLQAAAAAYARRTKRRPLASSLYQRIQVARMLRFHRL
jgi:hypothetical protein